MQRATRRRAYSMTPLRPLGTRTATSTLIDRSLLLGLVRSGAGTVRDALWSAGLSPVDVRTAVEGTERRTG